MEKSIFEHKKIFFSVVSLIVFYFFILKPIENIYENLNYLKNKEKKIHLLRRQNKEIQKNIQILTEEKKEIQKNLISKISKKDYFTSLGKFEKTINNLLKKNKITFLELGRISIKEKNIYSIPYLLEGKKENIFNFMLQLDEDKKINFLKNFIEIKKYKENIKCRFTIEIPIVKKDEKPFNKKEQLTLKILNIFIINKNKAVLYIKHKDYINKIYIQNNSKQAINKALYNINFYKNKLILKNLETYTDTIFNLEVNNEEI